jgi:hypothetical protein
MNHAPESEPETPIKPRWMRLARYCELTGDTRSAVHNRRYCGQWRDGEHTRIDPNGRTWVNIDAAEAWIEAGRSLGATSLQSTRARRRADLRTRVERR